MTVESDAAAWEAIAAFTERRGATKKAVLSQLILWFAVAPDSIKDVVQGWVPEDMRAEYAAQWRKWADTIESGVTADPKPVAPLDDITVNLPVTQEIRRRRRGA